MEWHPYRAVGAGRRMRDMSQQELADHLTRKLGERWTRQMVAHLEVGRKHFTVETLLAVSQVLDLPIDFFVYEPGKVRANPGYRKPVDSDSMAGLETQRSNAVGYAPIRRLLDRFGVVAEDGGDLRPVGVGGHHLAA